MEDGVNPLYRGCQKTQLNPTPSLPSSLPPPTKRLKGESHQPCHGRVKNTQPGCHQPPPPPPEVCAKRLGLNGPPSGFPTFSRLRFPLQEEINRLIFPPQRRRRAATPTPPQNRNTHQRPPQPPPTVLLFNQTETPRNTPKHFPKSPARHEGVEPAPRLVQALRDELRGEALLEVLSARADHVEDRRGVWAGRFMAP